MVDHIARNFFFFWHFDQRRLKAVALTLQEMKNAGNGDFSHWPNALRVFLEVVIFEVVVVDDAENFEDSPSHVGTANPSAPKF